MVNLGRPSRACLACKKRRIKCDETQPACFNCIKYGHVCPGLPTEADLIFRTVDPSRKKPLKDRSGKKCEKQIAKDAIVHHQSTRNHGQRLLADTTFNPTAETVATTFFFNASSTPQGRIDASTGYIDLAIPMYLSTQDGSLLHLAVEALSLASLSKRSGMRDLERNASMKYSQALRSLGKTLVNQKQASSNATLATILLLSSYEATSCSDQACSAWAQHIEGAATIVVARGADQMHDEESLALFRSVRAQMLANVIQQRKPMPGFPDPKGWSIDLDASETAVLEQNLRLASLLSKARPTVDLDRTPEAVAEVENLLQEAYDLMLDIAEREYRTPVNWLSRTVANTYAKPDLKNVEDMEIWPLPYLHVYKDIESVCLKNMERSSHMPCCSLVIDALKWLSPNNETYTQDYRYLMAKARLQTLADDVCASVAYCWYGEDAVVQGVRKAPRQRTDSESLGGYKPIWPFLAASTFEEIPELQREWLRGRFVAMGRHYGMEESKIQSCMAWVQ